MDTQDSIDMIDTLNKNFLNVEGKIFVFTCH